MKVSKKLERLARALAYTDSKLSGDIALDRAHIYWHESLEKAKEIISVQNHLIWYEGYGRSLHGSTEDVKDDLELYNKFFTGGQKGHEQAFAVVVGVEYEPSPDVQEKE